MMNFLAGREKNGVAGLFGASRLLCKHSVAGPAMEREKPLSIMLVEDNPADVYLLRAALADLGIETVLNVFASGTEAWNFLHGLDGDQQIPDLIILDLNLPGMNGREILREILNNHRVRHLPVAVFSGSAFESGVTEDFPELYILFSTKPHEFDQLKETLARVVGFAESITAE